jgi:hypothetical protein
LSIIGERNSFPTPEFISLSNQRTLNALLKITFDECIFAAVTASKRDKSGREKNDNERGPKIGSNAAQQDPGLIAVIN